MSKQKLLEIGAICLEEWKWKDLRSAFIHGPSGDPHDLPVSYKQAFENLCGREISQIHHTWPAPQD